MDGCEKPPAGLEWYAFSSRYFPDRRRHDLEVLKAYEAYAAAAAAAPSISHRSRLHLGEVLLSEVALAALLVRTRDPLGTPEPGDHNHRPETRPLNHKSPALRSEATAARFRGAGCRKEREEAKGFPIDADDPATEREPTDGALNLLDHPPSRVS